jgi:4-hydroxy-2-oxoheptanedioate aldolase
MRRMGEAGSQAGPPGGRHLLGVGTRGRGSEPTAAAIWGLSHQDYMERSDPWPLNPRGELLLGVKLESPEGVASCEAILAVPGLAFAEMGPGDLGLALGYPTLQLDPIHRRCRRRDRVCRLQENGIAFLKAARRQTSSRGWTRACG